MIKQKARELLAASYRESGDKAQALDVERRIPYVQHAIALRAIEAALSSHRQAGDDLSKFRELAERWRAGVGIDLETRLQCADELLALIEKGAG